MIKTYNKIDGRKNRLNFIDEVTTVKMDGSDTLDRTLVDDNERIGVREPVLPDDKPGEKIIAAFSSPEDWRTVGGISRATGLSYETVQTFIDENELL